MECTNEVFGRRDGNAGCVVIIAIVLLCVAVSWARRNPGTAAMVVCALAAIGLAWYMWDKHSQSESKCKLFDTHYGKKLENYEKDFKIAEDNFGQTKKVADVTDVAIGEIEQDLRTLS